MDQRECRAMCTEDGLGFSLRCLINDVDKGGGGTLGDEKCGLCFRSVSDRGRLSGCDHMFCFGCVDSGSRLTNACPVCKQRFKYISRLLLVHRPGSAGSSDGRLDAKSREVEEVWIPIDVAMDERCCRDQRAACDADGPGFSPCHYVNEDAVECLDGKGCLFRDGLTMEDGREMAVACDGCDRWFHTRCVNFRANDMSQESWHCLRCSNGYSLVTPGAMVLSQFEAPGMFAAQRGTATEEGSEVHARTPEQGVDGRSFANVEGTDSYSFGQTREWIVGKKWASEGAGESPNSKDGKMHESSGDQVMHDMVITDLVLASDSVRAKGECRQASGVPHPGGGCIAGENGREDVGPRTSVGSRKGLVMGNLARGVVSNCQEDEKGNWGLDIGIAEKGGVSNAIDPSSRQQLSRVTIPKGKAPGRDEGLHPSPEAGNEAKAVSLLGRDLFVDVQMRGKVCHDDKDQQMDDKIAGEKRRMPDGCDVSAETKRPRLVSPYGLTAADIPDALGSLPRGPALMTGVSKSSVSHAGEQGCKDGPSTCKLPTPVQGCIPTDDSGVKKDSSLPSDVEPSKVGASVPCEENPAIATTMIGPSNVQKSEDKSKEEKLKEAKEKVIARSRSLKRTFSVRERGMKSTSNLLSSESSSRGWCRGLTQSVPQQPTPTSLEAEIDPEKVALTAKGGSSSELTGAAGCQTAKSDKLDPQNVGRQKTVSNEAENLPSLEAAARDVDKVAGFTLLTKLKGTEDAGAISSCPLEESSGDQIRVTSTDLLPSKPDKPGDLVKIASLLPPQLEDCADVKPSSSLASRPDETGETGKASCLPSRPEDARDVDTGSQVMSRRPEESQDLGKPPRPEEGRNASKPSGSLPPKAEEGRQVVNAGLSLTGSESQNAKNLPGPPARAESQGAGKGITPSSRADSEDTEGPSGLQPNSESEGQSKAVTTGLKTSAALQTEADIDDLPLVVLQKPARRAKVLKERGVDRGGAIDSNSGAVDGNQSKKEQGVPTKSGPPMVSGGISLGERAPGHGRGSRDSLLKKLQKGGKKGLDPELAMRLSMKNAAKVSAATQGSAKAAGNPPAGKGSTTGVTSSGGITGQKRDSLRDRICPGDVSLMARKDNDEKPAKRVCRSDGGVSTIGGGGGPSAGCLGHRDGGSMKGGSSRDTEEDEGSTRRGTGTVVKKSVKAQERNLGGKVGISGVEKESAGTVSVEQQAAIKQTAGAGADTAGLGQLSRSTGGKNAQAVKKIAKESSNSGGGVGGAAVADGKKSDTAQWAAKILAKKGDGVAGAKGFVNGLLKRRGSEGKNATSGGPAAAADRFGQKELGKGGVNSNEGINKRGLVGGPVGANKTNFELLFHLPKEMRPQIANNLRSKVPSSIRQFQLDRILESHLRVVAGEGGNVRRASIADLEDAIASAVRMENTAFQRSSGKIVYLNLIKKELANLMTAANELGVRDRMSSQDEETTQRKFEAGAQQAEASEQDEAETKQETEPPSQQDEAPIEVEKKDKNGGRESEEGGSPAGKNIVSLLAAVFGGEDESDDDEVICMGPSKKADASGCNQNSAVKIVAKAGVGVQSEEQASTKGVVGTGGSLRAAGAETKSGRARGAGGAGARERLSAMGETTDSMDDPSMRENPSKVGGDRGGSEHPPTQGGELTTMKVDCSDPPSEVETTVAKQQAEQRTRSRLFVSVPSDEGSEFMKEESAAPEPKAIGSCQANSSTLPETEEGDGRDTVGDRVSVKAAMEENVDEQQVSIKAATEENVDQQQMPLNEQLLTTAKVRAKGGGKGVQLAKDRTAMARKLANSVKAAGMAGKGEKSGLKKTNQAEVGRESQVGDTGDIKGENVVATEAKNGVAEAVMAESTGGKEDRGESVDLHPLPHPQSDATEIDGGEGAEEGLGSTSLMASDDCKSAVKQGGSREGGRDKDSEEDADGGTSSRQPIVQDQVTSFVKVHLKPLLDSGVISHTEFAWATVKTAAKVMQHHEGATEANFLIREGARVRKLSEQYLEAFRKKSSRGRTKTTTKT